MIEGILHTRADGAFGVMHQLRAEITARTYARQRHRQSCLLLPPVAQVHGFAQSVIHEGKAAFVDDEPRVHVTRFDCVQNAIVSQFDDVGQRRRGETQQAVRRRFAPWNRHAFPYRVGKGHRGARDDKWTDTLPQCRTASQQPIPIADRREGTDAHFRQVKFA